MSEDMPLHYWEDLEVGIEETSPGRTITEVDIQGFAALTGDYNEIHTNEEFASKGPYKTRIAHGLLGLSISFGLKYRTRLLLSTQRNTVGFMGLNWSIRGAIKPGDTVYAKVKVVSKRETKDPSRGIVVFKLETLNQRHELVQEAETSFVILRRPAS